MPGRRLPNLHAIRAFEAAARHGSLTRAADELAVTPGAVSRHVRALEERMKTPLFVRRATGLELTASGEALARPVGEALDRIAEAASGVRMRRHPPLSVDLHSSLDPLDLLPGRYDAVIAVSDAASRSGLVTHRLLPIATVPVCAPS